MCEVADLREHGTTAEPPRLRFERDEAAALQPLNGRPSFGQVRELVPHGTGQWAEGPRVQADCAVEVDANSDSVPWRLVGESVQVIVAEDHIRIFHAGQEIAAHAGTTGRKQRVVDAAPALLRPLTEYEQIAWGGWRFWSNRRPWRAG